MFGNDIQSTIILTTLLILLLIAGVVITIFVANRKHVQQQVAMTQLQLAYEKELRQVEQEVQEQVLINVARELHDNIGQMLTVMNIQLEQQKVSNPDMAGGLNKISDTLMDTVQQVRLLSKGLNSDLFEQNSMLSIIGNEVQRLTQLNKLSIHWEHDDVEPALAKEQRIVVFRIFQEVINNIFKHADAKNIYVKLTGKDAFKLSITDDGVGFDMVAATGGNSGSGLKNIPKRAALANLDSKMESGIGKGTIFMLSSS